MRLNKVLPVLSLLFLSLMGASCGGSYMSKATNPPPPNGTDALEEQLVRVADLEAASAATFPNFGVDVLTTGSVKTEADENNGGNNNDESVKFAVTEANDGTNYSAQFCPFSGGVAGCMPVGAFTTDNLGNASLNLGFPQTGTFAGVFLISRQNQPQFVTGFTVPGTAPQSGNTRSFEVDLQRVASVSGGLGAGFPAAGTDTFTSGRVEVGDGNQPVEITLVGAAKAANYAIKFCRFGAGAAGCFSVTSVTTDSMGNANAELAFPETGTFDGVFILTRSVNGQTFSEFVTGFQR